MYQLNVFPAVQLVFGEEKQIIFCFNIDLAHKKASEA